MHTLGSRTRAAALATVCVVVGVAFGPSFAGAADNLKDVFVANTAADPVPTAAVGTTNVAGSVAVSNLPAVQAVSGTVNVGNLPTAATLRRGTGSISLEAGFPRSTDIPHGVVVTDIRLERAAFADDDPVCQVWVSNNEGGSFGPLAIMRPSAAEPVDELHFETGILSSESGSLGLFANSDCRTRYLWTGYEQ